MLDITGYFLPASTGPQGVIPSGQTVTGNFGTTVDLTTGGTFVNYSITLPASAPVALTTANINFAASLANVTDGDATCTGTAAAPTAPAGKVCMYIYGQNNVTLAAGFAALDLPTQAFYVSWTAGMGEGHIFLTWAYTAP